MDIEVSVSGEKTQITLPGQFQDEAIAAFRKAVLDAGRASVVVSGEQVEKAGTAGVQILLAARRHLERQGGDMILVKPSQALTESLRELGLEEELRGMTN